MEFLTNRSFHSIYKYIVYGTLLTRLLFHLYCLAIFPTLLFSFFDLLR